VLGILYHDKAPINAGVIRDGWLLGKHSNTTAISIALAMKHTHTRDTGRLGADCVAVVVSKKGDSTISTQTFPPLANIIVLVFHPSAGRHLPERRLGPDGPNGPHVPSWAPWAHWPDRKINWTKWAPQWPWNNSKPMAQQ